MKLNICLLGVCVSICLIFKVKYMLYVCDMYTHPHSSTLNFLTYPFKGLKFYFYQYFKKLNQYHLLQSLNAVDNPTGWLRNYVSY